MLHQGKMNRLAYLNEVTYGAVRMDPVAIPKPVREAAVEPPQPGVLARKSFTRAEALRQSEYSGLRGF